MSAALKRTITHTQLFINGRWRPSKRELPLICPIDESPLTTVSLASEDDIHEAVQSAKDAFEGRWGLQSCSSSRSKILSRIGDLITKRKDEFAMIEHLNIGKPLNEALADVSESANYFHYYSSLCKENHEEKIDIPDKSFESRVIREPVGVVAAITPWNYPLLMASQKVAAALAAGCSVILKPSEVSPLTSLALASATQEADLPPGVLNVITAHPNESAALVKNPIVDKISFTGSERTGSWIMQEAAKRLCKVSLELGGKSPMIVFPDADITATLDWILMGFVYNSGQICSATSRLLVHDEIYDQLITRLVSKLKLLPVGPQPSDAEIPHIGPVVNKNQYDRVLGFIDRAVKSGQQTILGPGAHKPQAKGFFIAPTIFESPDLQSEIWNEEVFGPVLCVRRFHSEQEAIKVANNTRFGLAASVMTSNKERAERVSKAMRSGVVWINCSQPAFVQAPWGGSKASGLGRELGRWGLEEFQEIKQVRITRVIFFSCRDVSF
eukprot:TRINITY_DN2244_c0_g1_i3.p1 TRINITY_DN2244_c0_g1~~TRINITY_DN2244_c0_g1_i3.p1  ORF type:complete len:498 (-),score=67.21 TRINITY_DN2244_c0_g1_i3:54-1547(-)